LATPLTWRRAALEAGLAEAQSQTARRTLWQLLAELAVLSVATGNHARAQALRAQATDVVQYIAAHTGSEALRESFLAQQQVRALL
jgi:hypothetical protein